MPPKYTKSYLDNLLGETETYQLEFKEARFLDKIDPETGKVDRAKRNFRISKHVSAMANAAGGKIIFGIQEKNKVAHTITPIDEREFTKEQLQQIIDHNIQPTIDGLEIHPVEIDSTKHEVAYVVEVPRSYTAHQANDFTYYQRRSGATTEKMNDSEIRDVMNRLQEAKLELILQLQYGENLGWRLYVRLKNVGQVVCNYASIILRIPDELGATSYSSYSRVSLHGGELHNSFSFYTENGLKYRLYNYSNTCGTMFVPIIPSLHYQWEFGGFQNDWRQHHLTDKIHYEVYGDTSPPQKGEITIKDIEPISIDRVNLYAHK